mmetsp:Transcript_59848/g.129037  ORF Transcript_59848/g.129037 Transcript_59848/m.129037 type:complete len:302 (+) Transcript_59848:24-929(+)
MVANSEASPFAHFVQLHDQGHSRLSVQQAIEAECGDDIKPEEVTKFLDSLFPPELAASLSSHPPVLKHAQSPESDSDSDIFDGLCRPPRPVSNAGGSSKASSDAKEMCRAGTRTRSTLCSGEGTSPKISAASSTTATVARRATVAVSGSELASCRRQLEREQPQLHPLPQAPTKPQRRSVHGYAGTRQAVVGDAPLDPWRRRNINDEIQRVRDALAAATARNADLEAQLQQCKRSERELREQIDIQARTAALATSADLPQMQSSLAPFAPSPQTKRCCGWVTGKTRQGISMQLQPASGIVS